MNNPDFIENTSSGLLAQRLADDVAGMLDAGIQQKGHASIAVSGGSTPKPFFKALSEHELAWSRISVTLADERWVDSQHADSNERLVRENLLVSHAAAAKVVGLYRPDHTPETVLPTLEKSLAPLLPFDVVVLGMGDDGHTASLFPDAIGLHEAIDLEQPAHCVAMQPPVAPHQRISLTLKALVSTRHLLVHITGQRKKDVLECALTDGQVDKAPIAALFLQSQVPVSVYWGGDSP